MCTTEKEDYRIPSTYTERKEEEKIVFVKKPIKAIEKREKIYNKINKNGSVLSVANAKKEKIKNGLAKMNCKYIYWCCV